MFWRLRNTLLNELKRRDDADQLGISFAHMRQAMNGSEGPVTLETWLGPFQVRPRNSDLKVMQQIMARGEYNLRALPHFGRLLERCQAIKAQGRRPLIVDAGANIGIAAVYLASLFDGCVVAAVEPDPANVALARANTANRPEIKVFEAAIGSESGYVTVKGTEGQGWSTETSRSEAGTPVLTIQDLVDQMENSELFIVKVDIEGFESDLFARNTDWIDQVAAIIVEPHDWKWPGQKTSASLQSALMGRGRDLLILGENLVFI